MTFHKFIRWVKKIRLGKFNIKLGVNSTHIHKEIIKKK